MGTIVSFSKLAELQAKTDQDLVRIIDGELDRGLALASVAASRRSVFSAQAEGVYNRAKALLSKTSGASGLDREELARLEHKLKELWMALDLVAGAMDVEREPACC